MLEKELHTELLRCVNSRLQSIGMRHEIIDYLHNNYRYPSCLVHFLFYSWAVGIVLSLHSLKYYTMLLAEIVLVSLLRSTFRRNMKYLLDGLVIGNFLH